MNPDSVLPAQAQCLGTGVTFPQTGLWDSGVWGPDTAQGAAAVCRWRTQYLLTHPINRDRRQGWVP